MKKLLTVLTILFFPLFGYSQFGVGYYQSSMSYAVGINYEIKDRFKPELRVGTNGYLKEFSLEIDLIYVILNKEEYEVYSGLGLIYSDSNSGENHSGLVIPVGLNVYPFSTRFFGFLVEISPILLGDSTLRGSIGFRYNF